MSNGSAMSGFLEVLIAPRLRWPSRETT